MNRTVATWVALAALAGGWGLVEAGAGAGALLPGLLAIVALGCAVDAGLRDRVMAAVLRAFSGSSLRVVVIVIGAAFLWQIVGVELALLMAGDVLAYLEVVAAVSLIAGRTRLRPVRTALALRVRQVASTLRTWSAVLAGTARAVRTVYRRPPPARDSDGPERDWAIA